MANGDGGALQRGQGEPWRVAFVTLVCGEAFTSKLLTELERTSHLSGAALAGVDRACVIRV